MISSGLLPRSFCVILPALKNFSANSAHLRYINTYKLPVLLLTSVPLYILHFITLRGPHCLMDPLALRRRPLSKAPATRVSDCGSLRDDHTFLRIALGGIHEVCSSGSIASGRQNTHTRPSQGSEVRLESHIAQVDRQRAKR